MTNEELIDLIEDSLANAVGVYKIERGTLIEPLEDRLWNLNLIEIGSQE